MTLTKHEEETFDRSVRQLNAVLQLVKLVVGMGAVCVLAIGGAFVWINNTSTAIAATRQEVGEIRAYQANLSLWQSHTDKTIERLITLAEGQEKTNNRLEQLARQRSP